MKYAYKRLTINIIILFLFYVYFIFYLLFYYYFILFIYFFIIIFLFILLQDIVPKTFHRIHATSPAKSNLKAFDT